MSDKEPLKITLADLGEPEPAAEPENAAAATPERGRDGVLGSVEQVGQRVAGAVKDSTARVAHKIADTTTEATSRGAEAVREKMGETIQAQSKATADAIETRLREVNWKGEAQKGAEGGLRWLSQRLDDLAEKLRAGKEE